MKNSAPDNKLTLPGTNPNTMHHDGAINPSAPSVGTEGYGTASDERELIGGSNPTDSELGTEGAGDVRKTSYPRNEKSDNSAAHESHGRTGEQRTRSKQLSDNPDARGGKIFNCNEVGPASCNWSVRGENEQEMIADIEKHGREAHGITIDDKLRTRVHDAIHDRAA